MYRLLFCSVALLGFSACSGVGDKVMQDFGLQERPADYEAGTDRASDELERVGKTEMARLNNDAREGEVVLRSENEAVGTYFRERKIYESYKVLDSFATTGRRGTGSDRGFSGYIEYTYEVYESLPAENRLLAERAPTTVSTGRRNTTVLRYEMNAAGRWNGSPGRER